MKSIAGFFIIYFKIKAVRYKKRIGVEIEIYITFLKLSNVITKREQSRGQAGIQKREGASSETPSCIIKI
jgi:hypothetical protein